MLIIEAILVMFAFTKSFWLGLSLLGYIVYSKDKFNKVEDQLRACLSEEENEELKPIEVDKTPDKIYPYKECVIEQFGQKFLIMKPNGDRLAKVFESLKDAQEEIDLVDPFLIKPKRKRSRIHNIRFVK